MPAYMYIHLHRCKLSLGNAFPQEYEWDTLRMQYSLLPVPLSISLTLPVSFLILLSPSLLPSFWMAYVYTVLDNNTCRFYFLFSLSLSLSSLSLSLSSSLALSVSASSLSSFVRPTVHALFTPAQSSEPNLALSLSLSLLHYLFHST